MDFEISQVENGFILSVQKTRDECPNYVFNNLGSMQHWISEKLSEEYDPQLDKTKNIFGEELPSLDFIAKELKDDLKRRHHNQIDDRKLGK